MAQQGTEQFDAIVIGVGQSGNPVAVKLAKSGWKVALIEREHVGGSCINYGCTPTKTMISSARVAHLANRGEDYGVKTGGNVPVDFAKVQERKNNVVNMMRGGLQKGLGKVENLELIYGKGSFTGQKAVKVEANDGNERHLQAEKIFINTGTRARVLPIEGIDQVPYKTSRDIMDVEQLPEHLLVIGGGYIGLEFSQMFRRFGSKVSVIEFSDKLLPNEDDDVGAEMTKILQDEGVDLHLGAKAQRVEQTDRGIRLTATVNGKEQTLEGSHLLMAAGRTPNTDGLNLDAAGVEIDKRGSVAVNNQLVSSNPHVYALGDVKGGPAFTHISYDDSRVVTENILNVGNASIEGRIVPYTMFTDPQYGKVGLSEREANEKGYNYRVAKLPMEGVARAIEMDETRGFMKAIVDADTDQILGAQILGVEGGEVMSVLQTAMMGQLPYQRIKEGIYAHPLLAESLNNLFMKIK
jgi:dihydrolipoamide dehydrogenase